MNSICHGRFVSVTGRGWQEGYDAAKAESAAEVGQLKAQLAAAQAPQGEAFCDCYWWDRSWHACRHPSAVSCCETVLGTNLPVATKQGPLRLHRCPKLDLKEQHD